MTLYRLTCPACALVQQFVVDYTVLMKNRNFDPFMPWMYEDGIVAQLHYVLFSTPDWGACSNSRSGRFIPGEESRYPLQWGWMGLRARPKLSGPEKISSYCDSGSGPSSPQFSR